MKQLIVQGLKRGNIIKTKDGYVGCGAQRRLDDSELAKVESITKSVQGMGIQKKKSIKPIKFRSPN
jgi:uncharacterized protein YunC (DUF1805 family)